MSSKVSTAARALAGLLVVGRLLEGAVAEAAPVTSSTSAEGREAPDLTLRLGSTTSTAPRDPPEGLILPDLVALALGDSFQVKVSQAQVAEARALYQLAVSQAYPRGQGRLLFGGPTPERTTRVRNDIDTVTAPSFDGDLDFGDLGVTLRGNAEAGFPLFTFGQIGRGKEASSHLVDAALHQVTATRADVVVDLTRAYWGWQLLKTLIDALEEGERRLEGVLEQIEALLEADSPQVTENDRLRLKFALSTLSVRRAQAQGGIEQLEQAVRLLIGRSQAAPLVLREESLERAVPKTVPPLDDIVARSRFDRPELRALRDVVEAQRAFRALREAQLFPTLFLGGFINFAVTTNATDQTNPFIFDPYNFVDAGVGLGLQFELDFFTKLAQIEQAEAQLNVRRRQETLATEASELEVRSLHARIRAELEQTRRLERANLSARGWLTAATLAYDVGAGRADELIDAFLAWATSQAELHNTRYNNIVHFAELARATGTLIQTRTPR